MKYEVGFDNEYDSVRFFDIATGKDKAGSIAYQNYVDHLETNGILYSVELGEETSIVMVVAKDIRNPKRCV